MIECWPDEKINLSDRFDNWPLAMGVKLDSDELSHFPC